MTGRTKRAAGFTLLEVMVAMAILAAVLTWVVVGMARNISAENHAKLITTATFLARSKMNDLEDELYEKGFGEFEKELTGTFEDKGFQRFSWRVVVDKVELPSTDQVQSMLGKANDAKDALTGKDSTSTGTTSTTDPMTSSVGAMSSQFGLIKDVLEGGIRRLTVQVLWYEGQKTYDVSVVAFYTDPRRVDQAVQIAAAPPGTQQNGASNGASANGTSGTSSSSTSTAGAHK
jgi:general secretion pathway protein I